MPVEEKREKSTGENQKTPTRDEIKKQVESGIQQRLNDYYKQVISRLETEVNMLSRYELKIEAESIIKIYNLLFN